MLSSPILWNLFLFRAPTHSTSIDINGEDAPQFLTGFAENIGLENVRTATIVSAAIAAHTRSCLLQAWVNFLLYILWSGNILFQYLCLLQDCIFVTNISGGSLEIFLRLWYNIIPLNTSTVCFFLFDGHRHWMRPV